MGGTTSYLRRRKRLQTISRIKKKKWSQISNGWGGPFCALSESQVNCLSNQPFQWIKGKIINQRLFNSTWPARPIFTFKIQYIWQLTDYNYTVHSGNKSCSTIYKLSTAVVCFTVFEHKLTWTYYCTSNLRPTATPLEREIWVFTATSFHYWNWLTVPHSQCSLCSHKGVGGSECKVP